ncbi:TolB family protein [Streptomyces sp. SHP 1-2]|uniref:TolB family protein n=1 Tax=Streptomyces sp. SHP 1-2 TaxID=2769489 RepID=UPI002238E7D1|nr:hypothetical protein [Streptomyces sp. SHP 1-2]MCW5250432.1 PD40 domain-containing protein [Streptomyces sp. SHP 1-2]
MALLAGAAAALPATAAPGTGPVRVSTGAGGAPSDGDSYANGLSGNGRYALFSSDAANLVPGDTNGATDLFVRDLRTGRVERVDVGTDGRQSATGVAEGAISGDGRYVAFVAANDGLVTGEADGGSDVYVRDLATHRTRRVTRPAPGAPADHEGSMGPLVISRDGRYIAFQSKRQDLDPGRTRTYPVLNIFVADRATGVSRVVSIGADGSPSNGPSVEPGISADGRKVTFTSRATNLLPDDGSGTPGEDPGGTGGAEADGHDGAEADGKGGAEADAPGVLKPRAYPLYLYDLDSGRTSGASVNPDGKLTGVAPASSSVAPDGRHVVFIGWEIDRRAVTTHRYVAYLRDLRTGRTTEVGRGLGGADGTGEDTSAVMSADGRWVYFTSDSDNLVPGDTDGRTGVFRHDPRGGRTEPVRTPSDTSDEFLPPLIDAHGRTLLFTEYQDTAPDDANGFSDVFALRTRRR